VATRALTMLEWIEANEIILWWMLIASIAAFIAAIIGAPLWVIKIPNDYFAEKKRKHDPLRKYGMTGAMLKVGKNMLGTMLVLIGILMLVLPGQGLLTILVGIMLMDLPGKYKMARWIVAHPPVLQSMNWIRRRAGRPPLTLDQ
jgi:hypothetical protein